MQALLASLEDLKHSMAEVSSREQEAAGHCQARLAHLHALSQPKASVVAWNMQRMDRLLVDYLLR